MNELKRTFLVVTAVVAVAYLHHGNAYFNKGEYAEALENYGQMLALIPDDAEALAMRERAREAAGAEDTAPEGEGSAGALTKSVP
jgi:tetratricopeptide (TPR) repeat protein